MSAPTFTTVNWLSQVLAVDPDHYAWPVAYEFGHGRKFRKSDDNWYILLAAMDEVPDGSVLLGEDAVLLGDDYLTMGE